MDNQTEIVFSMSLNPIDSIIRYNQLLDKWKKFNRSRRQTQRRSNNKATHVSFKSFLYFKGIDLDKYINKPVDRLEYYRSKGRYLNNVKV